MMNDWIEILNDRIQKYEKEKAEVNTALKGILEEFKNKIKYAVSLEIIDILDLTWKVSIYNQELLISYHEIKERQKIYEPNPAPEKILSRPVIGMKSIEDALKEIILDKFIPLN